MSSEYLRPDERIEKHGEMIPHWNQDGVMQFVTFRLGDSLPRERVDHWMEQRRVWMLNHPKPWANETEIEYQRKFTWRLERWLDQGAGSCLLKDASVREVLVSAMRRFDGERVHHHAWVIMPNHVHLLFTPVQPLDELVKIWKSVSATRIGKGPIWQRNYRDTMIRDGEHFKNAVRYIRRNPLKAKLREGEFSLWEGERAKMVK